MTFWPTPDRGFQSCACHTTGMFLPMRSLQCFKSKPHHAAAGAIKRLANCTARCHMPKPNHLFFIVYRSDVQRDRVNKLFFCNKGTRNTEDVEVYDKQSRIGWIKDRCIVSSREQRCASSFTSSPWYMNLTTTFACNSAWFFLQAEFRPLHLWIASLQRTPLSSYRKSSSFPWFQ